MDIFEAMRPNNGVVVSQLISDGADVNARNASGLTVIQYAADEYASQIGSAGSLTEEAQYRRQGWADSIDPLVATDSLSAKKVTLKAWNSPSVAGLPSSLDVMVDAMLHDLGYTESELAVEQGYTKWLDGGRVKGASRLGGGSVPAVNGP